MQIKIVFASILLFSGFLVQAQDPEEISTELRIKIESLGEPLSKILQNEVICCRKAVPEFYQSRMFSTAWDEFLATELIAAIDDCKHEGLNPADYHFEKLQELDSIKTLSAFERADYELLLTDAFLLLSSHLMSGKVHPQSIDTQWKELKTEGNPVELLEGTLISRNIRSVLESIKPSFKGYERLKERLLTYRKIAVDGGWSKIPDGVTIKPGMESERVEVLRKRLRITGDLKSYTVEDLSIYDDTVSMAVRQFQKRHGLAVDGNVGRETLAALNVPVEYRIEQMILNMERCRWLPRVLGHQYVMVNLPAYELEVVKDGNVELEMDVAVGKPYRETPVFSAKMSYLVFNPYWIVPPTILSQDIIPAQRKNPNYLKNLNIKVIAQNGVEVPADQIDWGNINPKKFPYSLRQEPGSNNALGQVKFMFPNPYNVYMHDTNHKELFSRTERALSSGCIRLSQPMTMAQYLLGSSSGWTEDRINEIVRSKQNYSVTLKNPIPVYMQYWTSFVDEKGRLNFRKDIYNRDDKVKKALKERPPQV